MGFEARGSDMQALQPAPELPGDKTSVLAAMASMRERKAAALEKNELDLAAACHQELLLLEDQLRRIDIDLNPAGTGDDAFGPTLTQVTLDPSADDMKQRSSLPTTHQANARANYAQEVLQPMLALLAKEAIESMPARLAAFLVCFLLQHLQAPPRVMAAVQNWLNEDPDPMPLMHSQSRDLTSSLTGLVVPPTPGADLKSPYRSLAESGNLWDTHSVGPWSRSQDELDEYVSEEQAGMQEVGLEEAVSLISNVPIFQQMTEEDIERLAEAAEVCTFGPDWQVVNHGTRHEALHLIVSGEGCVSVPQVVGTLKRGDSFGEHALVRRHLKATQTISVPGEEGAQLVTLAISYKMLADLDLLPRLSKARRKALGSSQPSARSQTLAGDPDPRGSLNSLADEDEFQSLRLSLPLQDQSGAGDMPTAFSSMLGNREREEAIFEKAQMSPEDKELVLQAIKANVHFSEWLQLSQTQVEMMADMMYQTTAKTGDNVVRRGEPGDKFYIVSNGILEVFAGDVQTDNAVRVKLRSGDSFGELALLYNCPRKATVRAMRPCTFWVLDRSRFRSVMRLRSENRIQEYVRLIDSADFLRQRLSGSEKRVLADALEEVFFVQGEEVLTQNQVASIFFIVFEGCCEIRMNGEVRGFLQKGDYYGEKALIGETPQLATVGIISETAMMLVLDSASFHLILGDAMSVPTPRENSRRRSNRCTTADLISRLLVSMPGSSLPKVAWDSLEEIGVLGQGSFGFVTLQRDRVTGKLYALKAQSKGYIKSKRLEQHVLNERRTMEMLGSDFLVKMYCTYRCPQYVYFLLEPALGGELYDLYVQNEHMFGSTEHAKFYVVCATLGLQHLHERRIIYRDLKLENALLYSNGYVCLTDLGLAKVVIGKTYTVCGTPDYLAPEILRQTGHNRAVDWWALGVILFITMAGRSPFDAEDVMQIYRNIVKGLKRENFPVDFSPELVDLIMALCRKKPERRLPMGPGSIGNIQAHPWFQGYPWNEVRDRTLDAPYKPPDLNLEALRRQHGGNVQNVVEFVHNDPETDEGWDAEF